MSADLGESGLTRRQSDTSGDPRKGRMPLGKLKVMLDAEKADALASQAASKLSKDRVAAMDYYLGDMSVDMPTIEGRSQAVSTDVLDSVQGMMPSLMEIFAGSDDVVRFDPVGPDDVAQAAQETDYINYVFMQKNNGFLVLYHMLMDALLSKTGIAKVWWCEQTKMQRSTFYDQSDDVYALLASDPDIEILEHTERDTDFGSLHDVTIGHKKDKSYARVDPVPPEEFGMSRRARTTLQDATYMFHEVVKPQNELVDQGYSYDQLSKLATYNFPRAGTAQEVYARDTVWESSGRQGDDGLNQAIRPIRVTEHYVMMDYEGDGVARKYRVTTAGEEGEILILKDEESDREDIEQIDFWPFAYITPFIQPHRFYGRSMADVTMDIQRVKTAILRSSLDNAYLATHPITEVAEPGINDSTLDDLLVRRPGGIVRTAQPGMVREIVPTSTLQQSFDMLQYWDSVREWRTGVSRQGQGLDAEALNNQTATAAMQVYNASQARMKLIARVFAETGIRDLFWLLHATIRKYGERADTIRLRNQWVTVDPRNWIEREDLTVHVGLGHGGKVEQMAGVNAIANAQERLLMGGMAQMVTPKNLFNTASELVRSLGKKDVDDFFTDPGDGPMPQQQQVDPEQAKMQMQAQIEQMKVQADTQTKQVQLQADMANEKQKAMYEAQLDQLRFQHETQLKSMEAENQMRIETMRLQHQSQEKHRDREAQAAQASVNGGSKRDGQVVITGAKRTMDGVAKQISSGFDKLSSQLADSHRANMEAHQEVVKAATAPRKTELIRDEKTRRVKGAVSKVDNAGV